MVGRIVGQVGTANRTFALGCSGTGTTGFGTFIVGLTVSSQRWLLCGSGIGVCGGHDTSVLRRGLSIRRCDGSFSGSGSVGFVPAGSHRQACAEEDEEKEVISFHILFDFKCLGDQCGRAILCPTDEQK